jgi:glucose/arabinose dehydrogenase
VFRTVLRTASVCALVAAVFAAVAQAAAGPPPPTSTNGNSVQLVATGLKTPTSFAFGGGSVFEGDGGNSQGSAPPNGAVYVLKGGTATELAHSPQFVAGLAWNDNALYVSGGYLTSSGAQFEIAKWSGWNGTSFAHRKAIWVAPKKLQGLNGIAFGPDGRLYAGVDVGLVNNNDHGPASLSPYLYDILSMQPNGHGLKVYATGIRQPWQFVFPKGATEPLVSDLGQDGAAVNPPDFLLKVAKGDNYGFPKCNWTAATAAACKHATKPFKMFAPHTDIMGLAALGKTLYMTSFTGPGGKGPGGVVYSMPLKGGAYKPLVSGFVAPIVGLGLSGSWLYIGELTGQVFRIKV